MQDRVRRSLKAIEQDRGHKLNAWLAEHPEAAAKVRELRQESQRKLTASKKVERAARGPTIAEIKRQFWDGVSPHVRAGMFSHER